MQFTLSFMLAVVVLVALSLAVFGAWGLFVGAILVGIVLYVRSNESRWRALAIVGLVLLCGSCLIGLLLPAVSCLSEAARRCQCRNNLKQIGLGLHNYQETYRRLPPVQEGDEAGQPPCSWRVRLLPFLEQDPLFQQYNFREPSDGPNNLKLASQSPSFIYRCPSSRYNRTQGTTNYLAVVGPDGNWLEPDNREGDVSNPVRVVETCQWRVAWMEPRDVSLRDLHSPSSLQPPALSSQHIDRETFFYRVQYVGANALFADGRVHLIPPDVPGDLLRAALLGDRQKQRELVNYGRRELNWPNCIALASLVICFLLMLAWPRRQAMWDEKEECREDVGSPETTGSQSH